MLPVLHTQQAVNNSVSYVAEHDCNALAIGLLRNAPRPLFETNADSDIRSAFFKLVVTFKAF